MRSHLDVAPVKGVLRKCLVKSNGGSERVRAGVRDADCIKDALDGAVFTVATVERIHNDIHLPSGIRLLKRKTIHMPLSALIDEHINGLVFILPKMFKDARAGFERHI